MPSAAGGAVAMRTIRSATARSSHAGARGVQPASGAARERHREQLVGVGVELHELQARGGEITAQALHRELRADLRAQLLAGGELDVEVERRHVDLLRLAGE